MHYRINLAKETFDEVKTLINIGFFNNAVNRLYYACFYASIAFFIKNNIPAYTHAGVQKMLGLHFVITNKLETKYARFFSQLFNYRISGDYVEFVTFNNEMLEELTPKAQEYIDVLEKLINAE